MKPRLRKILASITSVCLLLSSLTLSAFATQQATEPFGTMHMKSLSEADITVTKTAGTANVPYIQERTYNTALTGDVMLAAVVSGTTFDVTADFGTYDIGPAFESNFSLLFNYNSAKTDNLHYIYRVGDLAITATRIAGEASATVNLDFSTTYKGVALETASSGNNILGYNHGTPISSADRLANVTEFYNYLVDNGIGTNWLLESNGTPITNYWYAFEMPLTVRMENGTVSVSGLGTKSIDFVLPADADFTGANVSLTEQTLGSTQIVGVCNWSSSYIKAGLTRDVSVVYKNKTMPSLADADITVTKTAGSSNLPYIQERVYNTALTGDVMLAAVASGTTFDVTADFGTFDIGPAFESNFTLLFNYNSAKTDNLHYVYRVGDLEITATRIVGEASATVNLDFSATYNGVALETASSGNNILGYNHGTPISSADRLANVTEFYNYLVDNGIGTNWLLESNGTPITNYWYAFEMPITVSMIGGIVSVSGAGTKTIDFVLPSDADFAGANVSLTEQTLGSTQIVGICNWSSSYVEENTVEDIQLAYKNESLPTLSNSDITVTKTAGSSNLPYIQERTYNTALTGDVMLAAAVSGTTFDVTADFGTYDIGPWFDLDYTMLYNYNSAKTDNLHYVLQVGDLVITAARIAGESSATINMTFSATYNGTQLEPRDGNNTVFDYSDGTPISSADRLANVTEFYNYLKDNGIGTNWLLESNGNPITNYWYAYKMPVSVKLRNGVVTVTNNVDRSISFVLPEDANFLGSKVALSEQTFGTTQIVGVCDWSGTYAAPVDSEIRFTGANLSVGEGIGINFYVPDALLTEYDSTYATVAFDVDGDGANDTVRIDPVDYKNGADYQKYTFNELTPDRMADLVYVTLYGVKDGQAAQITGESGYSVKQYALNTFFATFNPKSHLYGDLNLRKLLADMLTYGEAARLHAGTGTESILAGCSWVSAYASSGTVADQASCDKENITYLTNTVTASTAHFNWVKVAVDLRANPRLVYTFAPTANAASDLSGYSVVVEKDGTATQYPLPTAQNGTYTFSYDGLSAADMAKTVRVYVVDANQSIVSAAYDYSVESFAYNCYEQTNGGSQASDSVSLSLYSLSQALIRYGISAKTYVDNVNLGELVAYPEYDERIVRDYSYSVSVTKGNRTVDLTSYNHTDSVMTSNRTVNGDMYRRFCEFAFSGSQVRVDVTVHSDFESYTVMPSAREFTTTRNGNVISVYLDEPEYFLIKLDNKDDSILAVFADEPETDVPDKDDPNVIYVDGWYDPTDAEGNKTHHLTLDKAGTILYLAPGSVLNARVKVTAASVTIKGRGMILDPYSDVYSTNKSDTDDPAKRYILEVKADNCVIDGIKMIDARDYNLCANASCLTATNVKILASEMCTDGISQWSGDNNVYRHFFIYVGDNALVISGGQNNVFEDITIGSICCAVFPQSAVGTCTVDDIYIFRADEGVMRNCYNYNSLQRTFSMTLNNVNAVDCHHFPFIFYGWNMGSAAKHITFNNLAVPVATGRVALGEGDGGTIRVENVSGYLDTTNYTLTFNGLSIGGQAITDASQIPVNMTDGNTIIVTGNGAQNMPTLPATNSGSVVVDGKIYIGNRQLVTEQKAVKQGNVWYLPAEAVCGAVNRTVPTTTTNINGTAYISLTDLVSNGVAVSATYDAATGRINIAPPTTDVGNLVDWFTTDALSRWSEDICYEVHMEHLEGYDQNSFRIIRSANNGFTAGASYNLTEQMQQYGAGTYTLTFDARSSTGCTVGMKIGAKTGTQAIVKYGSTGALTSEWITYTMTYTLNSTVTDGVDPNNVTNAYLAIYAQAANAEVEIRSASVTFTPAS